MRQLFLAGALTACAAMFSGCGVVFVARSASYAPTYCSDCHYTPSAWGGYSSCNRYEIRVTRNGYYYRPRRHHGHVEYRFVEFRQTGERAHGDSKQEGKSRR